MSAPYRTTHLHQLQVHIFPSEAAHAAAVAAGDIGENDLVLTPDTGDELYQNLEAAIQTAHTGAQHAETIAATLEERLAAGAFTGPQGEPGQQGPTGPAGKNALSDTYTVTLVQSGWQDKAQALALSVISEQSRIMVSPDPACINAYAAAGVYAHALGAGTISFQCDRMPNADLTVHILLLNGE